METCATCAGKGEVVIPVPVVHQPTGEIRIIQRADICPDCAGSEKR